MRRESLVGTITEVFLVSPRWRMHKQKKQNCYANTSIEPTFALEFATIEAERKTFHLHVTNGKFPKRVFWQLRDIAGWWVATKDGLAVPWRKPSRLRKFLSEIRSLDGIIGNLRQKQSEWDQIGDYCLLRQQLMLLRTHQRCFPPTESSKPSRIDFPCPRLSKRQQNVTPEVQKPSIYCRNDL